MPTRRKPKMDEFTLEKLRISEKLTDIGADLKAHIQRFDHHCEKDEMYQKDLTKMVTNHDKMLLGTNGSDGMKIQIDRLAQKEKWRTQMYGAIWAAIAGLITVAVWNVLAKGT
jgi:hypothetical protein